VSEHVLANSQLAGAHQIDGGILNHFGVHRKMAGCRDASPSAPRMALAVSPTPDCSGKKLAECVRAAFGRQKLGHQFAPIRLVVSSGSENAFELSS
jgi:hypothetical protein